MELRDDDEERGVIVEEERGVSIGGICYQEELLYLLALRDRNEPL